jgi:hypothetical protein
MCYLKFIVCSEKLRLIFGFYIGMTDFYNVILSLLKDDFMSRCMSLHTCIINRIWLVKAEERFLKNKHVNI